MAEDKQENKPVKVYEKPGLTWVNITSPSPEALAEVKSRFDFLHDFDLRDCLPPFQRPKLIKRDRYLFMVLLFPVFNKETGKIRQTELDMFIGKDFVITNHFGELEPLADLDACYRGESDFCPRERLDNVAVWVHNLLAELLSGCFPMLTRFQIPAASVGGIRRRADESSPDLAAVGDADHRQIRRRAPRDRNRE